MQINLAQHGGRVPYVVVPIPGKVVRRVIKFEKIKVGVDERGNDRFQHRMVSTLVERPGGFMVFCPMGHAIRLTEQQLRTRRLHRKARALVDVRGQLDTKGKTLLKQQDQQAAEGGAYQPLELYTIHLATRRTGKSLVTRKETIPDPYEDEKLDLPTFKVGDLEFKEGDTLTID